MASFRLSARAKDELVAIYDDSEARFGSYQADAYLAGLERTFGLLADFPGIGQAADYLKTGFRRFRFQDDAPGTDISPSSCHTSFEACFCHPSRRGVSFLHRSQRPRDRSACSGAGAHLRMTLHFALPPDDN